MPLTRVTLSSLLLILSVPLLAQTKPLSDAQYGTIKALGELNAVALHCKYINETRRMKKSLVLTLPKVRQFGEAFDVETNKAFLAFMENKSSCPEESAFAAEVDSAILKLDEAFASDANQ